MPGMALSTRLPPAVMRMQDLEQLFTRQQREWVLWFELEAAQRDQQPGDLGVLHLDLAQRDRDQAGAAHRPAPHWLRTVCSDSCSTLFTAAHRFHATGSISAAICSSALPRNSFGSIASSSQQRSPWFLTNHS